MRFYLHSTFLLPPKIHFSYLHSLTHNCNSLLAFLEKSCPFCQNAIVHIGWIRTEKIVHQLPDGRFIPVCDKEQVKETGKVVEQRVEVVRVLTDDNRDGAINMEKYDETKRKKQKDWKAVPSAFFFIC